jgi:signal transduction histidine kinase
MSEALHDSLDQMLKGQAHSLSQIMQRNILTCDPGMTVAEAASQMVTTRCSSIVVLEQGKPAGIWTEHDALLVNPDDSKALDRPVGDVMSKPVRTINQNVTIEAATLRFRDEGLRHYVVVDDLDHLVGVISQSDVVRQHDVRHFLSMRAVGTVIRRSTLILQASSTLSQAAQRLHNHGTDCAVVIYGDGRRGIVTERDLLKAVASRRAGLKVGDVANSPIFSVPQTISVLEARETMERKGYRHLGVTDGEGTPVGMLSYADILASVEFSILRYVEEMLSERSRALNQTQNRLRGALEELNRTNEELEELAHAISHGFKTPLDKMTACLDRLGQADEAAVVCAKDQADQLRHMLEGISIYAGVGQASQPLQNVDLASVVASVLAQLRPTIEASGALVELPPVLPRVKGDEAQLSRLLRELLGNALRFRHQKRRLEIRVSSERQSGHWLISLADNGQGLDPSQSGRLFHLFQSVGEQAGVGIGLAVAKRIVERHGGRLWLEGAVGQGLVVRFTLPDSVSSP